MSGDRFTRALRYVLENEGGDSDVPLDTGGYTRHGITERAAAVHGLNSRTITLDQATSIYRMDYWLPAYDLIADEALAIKVFDFGVNAGPATSNRILQRAANDLGAKLTPDGILGATSLDAINRLNPDDLLRCFAWRAYEDHYAVIAERAPSQSVFLNGWRNRMSQVPILSQQEQDT